MVAEEKIQKINSHNYLIQNWILFGNVEHKLSDLTNLNIFNGIFLINDSTAKPHDSILWVEEIKNISPKNLLKIYINIKNENIKIINEDLKKYLQNNKIEFHVVSKDNLINYINEIINNRIANINKGNIEQLNSSSDLKENNSLGSNNSKEENKILKSLDSNLFFKTKNDLENCAFLYENNFENKIFTLLEKLQKFENAKIEDIYDFVMFLKSEKKNLEFIIHSLPLLTYKNKNSYLSCYYYYAINRLLFHYKSYKKKNEGKEENEYYELLCPNEESTEQKEEKDDISEKNEEFQEITEQEEIGNIKKHLEQKKKSIISELKKLYVKYNSTLENNNKINNQHEISTKIDINIGIIQNMGRILQDLKDKNSMYENILRDLESFASNDFKKYLASLSILLKAIPKTLNYFNNKIVKSDDNNKEDIDDFIDFLYFISNYDFLSNFKKISEIIEYFESYFNDKNDLKYINKKYNLNYHYFEIKDNTLTQISQIGTKTKIVNINNYCIDLINKYQLYENAYLNQRYLWFLKFRKNNFLERNKKVFVEFFQNIFKEDSMKELMKNIFPYLKENYIINEKYISDFFENIRGYNFHPRIHCGETMLVTLDVFIKSYFEIANHSSDICAVASYVIIILHEFAHYTRLYILNLTQDETYRNSRELCEENEIGDYLETLLFGEKMNVINLIQAIYILDENNYKNSYTIFKKEFEKIKADSNKKNNKINLKGVKGFIKKLNLNISEYEKKEPTKDFSIKTGNTYFIIGNYNDKCGRPVDLNEIFKGSFS